ncbi:MAG: DUF975 family protein, partial [Kiritimatiellia bacterium]
RWIGGISGPFALEDLREMLARGQVSRHHQVSIDKEHWHPIYDTEVMPTTKPAIIVTDPGPPQPVVLPSSTSLPIPLPEMKSISERGPWFSRTENMELMRGARAALKGYWGAAAAVMLIYLLIMTVGIVVQIVISGPMQLGLAKYFLTTARKEPRETSTMFSGFNRFLDGFVAFLLITLFVVLWFVSPYLLLGVLATVLCHYLSPVIYLDKLPPSLIFFGLVLLVALAIPSIIAAIRYSMTYLIMADNPDITASEAIGKSKAMMAGNKWKYVSLNCRFVGWIFLCFCTLGVGFLWLTPYTLTTQARFYDDLQG